MNAGTREDYIPDASEIVLGSSGHALKLRGENSNTSNLKLVLVEEDNECFARLKNVIQRRWKQLQWSESVDGGGEGNSTFLLNLKLERALEQIETIPRLGNSLFFFDPLLFTEWDKIERVAERRIKRFYQTGTEFILFLFTSDLFLGRKGLIAALPNMNDPGFWTAEQHDAVSKVDSLFGFDKWHPHLLNAKPLNERMLTLVDLYRESLHRWFRYVLPLPFEPKPGQLYHLFMCSNYEAGVRITRGFYADFTGNPKFSPDNRPAYKKFIALHPEKRLKGNSRCDEWKILWAVVVYHEDGICDVNCDDLDSKQEDPMKRIEALEWLTEKGYLIKIGKMSDAWRSVFDSYRVNWNNLTLKLGVGPPAQFKPLSSKHST